MKLKVMNLTEMGKTYPKKGRKEAALLFTEQGVPAWPEPRRSCGYSPPGFFPAPPA